MERRLCNSFKGSVKTVNLKNKDVGCGFYRNLSSFLPEIFELVSFSG